MATMRKEQKKYHLPKNFKIAICFVKSSSVKKNFYMFLLNFAFPGKSCSIFFCNLILSKSLFRSKVTFWGFEVASPLSVCCCYFCCCCSCCQFGSCCCRCHCGCCCRYCCCCCSCCSWCYCCCYFVLNVAVDIIVVAVVVAHVVLDATVVVVVIVFLMLPFASLLLLLLLLLLWLLPLLLLLLLLLLFPFGCCCCCWCCSYSCWRLCCCSCSWWYCWCCSCRCCRCCCCFCWYCSCCFSFNPLCTPWFFYILAKKISFLFLFLWPEAQNCEITFLFGFLDEIFGFVINFKKTVLQNWEQAETSGFPIIYAKL